MTKIDYKNTISELFDLTTFSNNPANSVHTLLMGKKIFLYGVGSGFSTFSVFILEKYGFKAEAVFDLRFKTNTTYFTIPAFSPLSYTPTDDEKENAIVVITVGKAEYHKEIFACLHNLGFKNIILATDIYEYHLHYTPKEIENKGHVYYLNNKEYIMNSFNLFSDDLSCRIFINILQTYLQKRIFTIPHRPLQEQYFPKDIKLSKGYTRFVNCGAYNGDTIMKLNALVGKVDAVACFEPCIASFGLLSQYLCAEHKKIAKSIVAFPCAVFSHETQLHFTSSAKSNNSLSADGDITVQCVALDHVIPNFKPTSINMDIEGAELEALKGAETLIKENKPDLAISIYHRSSHLWEVPRYLQSLNLGYRYYLRNYTSFISETILYATAPGR
jgi:FkbM family methyltransferase